MSKNSRMTLAVLVLATVALSGCRSDGGFGRRGSQRSLAWSTGIAAERFHDNADSIGSALGGIDDALAREFHDGAEGLESSYRLYFEGKGNRR